MSDLDLDLERPRQLCAQLQDWAQENGHLFEYPPATTKQLAETEERLGFALPPMLRLLYTTVANGGDLVPYHARPNRPFASSPIWFRILGVEGGCDIVHYGDENHVLVGTLGDASQSGWRINERVERSLFRYPGAYVECEDLPDRFVTIGYLMYECNESIMLDGWTGHLYFVTLGQDMHSYLVGSGDAPYEGSHSDYLYAIQGIGASCEDWIEKELRSESFRRQQRTRLTPSMMERVTYT